MAWCSAFVSLLLAISGSGALPVPHAFAAVGVVWGSLICVCVGYLNYQTTVWLVRCGSTYEEISKAAGFSPLATRLTEFASTALLTGTFAACLTAFGEACQRATGYKGTWPCLLAVCLLGSHSYDKMAWTSGLGLVYLGSLVLAVTIMFATSPHLWPHVDYDEAPSAASTLGYSFYLAPIAIAVLGHGESSVETVESATMYTFLAATIIYLLLGICGSAWRGDDCPGDIAVAFKQYGRLIAAATALYLVLSASVSLHPLRDSLRSQVGEKREKVATCLVLLLAGYASTATSSQSIFQLTGATAVCVTCYVVPVLAHIHIDPSPQHAKAMLCLVFGVGVSLATIAIPFLQFSPNQTIVADKTSLRGISF